MVGVSLKPPTTIKHGRSSTASCCEAHGCLSKMSTSWYPRIVSLSPQWVPLLVERRSFEAPFFSLVWMAKLTGTKFVNPVFDSNIWNGLFHVRSFVRDTSAWVDSDLPGLCEPNLEIYNHPRRKGFSGAMLGGVVGTGESTIYFWCCLAFQSINLVYNCARNGSQMIYGEFIYNHLGI